ncbi:MAG: alpha/beta hydrolase [Thermoguttaceae bacterium]|nr:alpha/beta hydrolase [Thermoguttaceae bacterium]
MSAMKKTWREKALWGTIYAATFIVVFLTSAWAKLFWRPGGDRFAVDWNESVGTVVADLSYGKENANKFDLYLPADSSRETYGLVVYLHGGGFTGGDKRDDDKILKWLCSLGYVAAGVNYTLASETRPGVNVYTQSIEIRDSIARIVEESARFGRPIKEMSFGGGSAGGCLALLCAYRDGKDLPVPVKAVFEAVGPSCFYPEDWRCYGCDKNPNLAAAMFGYMLGERIDPETFGTEAYEEQIKKISALSWIDSSSPPTLCAYGVYDKIQPYAASRRLVAALKKNGVPFDDIVFEHSGHGLQNDSSQGALYARKIVEYLDRYMPLEPRL